MLVIYVIVVVRSLDIHQGSESQLDMFLCGYSCIPRHMVMFSSVLVIHLSGTISNFHQLSPSPKWPWQHCTTVLFQTDYLECFPQWVNCLNPSSQNPCTVPASWRKSLVQVNFLEPSGPSWKLLKIHSARQRRWEEDSAAAISPYSVHVKYGGICCTYRTIRHTWCTRAWYKNMSRWFLPQRGEINPTATSSILS